MIQAHLFSELPLREITLRNRIVVSPMCQYSSEEGFANDWHFVHLGSRAVGGAGLVFTEAAAVEPEGRISPQDLGIYSDEHVQGLLRISRFIREHGAAAGIQIAHAGRKASTAQPWKGGEPLEPEQGGWRPVLGPSPIPFTEGHPVPDPLDGKGIARIVRAFAAAADRSLLAGFEVLEIHAAHGYLIHEFLSPLSNQRTDGYGGPFLNRVRFLREIVDAVRRIWPERLPLFVRLSVTDWADDGWDVEQSIELSRLLGPAGVDVIDCSSGGTLPSPHIPLGPGYQTAFADRIRREANVMTGAVGMITSPQQADHVIRTGQADLVLLAREMLRDPYWPRRAAAELKAKISGPQQYGRAWAS